MSIRPRRSAAQRANLAITDMADRDRDVSEQRTMSSRNPRRSGNGIASVSRGMPSSSPASSAGDGNQHIHLTVKLPSSKLRQATSSTNTGKRRPSGTVTAGASKRTRGGKKSYVIESSEDEEEEEEEEEDEEEDEDEEDEEDEVEEDEIEVGNRAGFAKAASEEDEEEEVEEEDEQMEDLGDDDADGDDDGDEMDVDADGDDDEDADADGDVDMDVTPAPRAPAIKITKPPKSTATPSKSKSASTTKPVAKGTAVIKTAAQDDDDDDDDDEELSELESEPEDVTVEVAQGDEDAEGDDDEDVDAEGEEEIEVADEDGEGEDEELGSDDDGSRAGTPDLSKLTARQRAKLGDASHEYLKLSDEVQAKKHFTAEELSMRRLEMARRRRNLSDKRNEEVKMETINKLLKKQAPKTTRKNAALLAAGDETPDTESQRADPMFIRWVNSKQGSRVAVPEELLSGPAGRVFGGAGIGGGKMVEEVS